MKFCLIPSSLAARAIFACAAILLAAGAAAAQGGAAPPASAPARTGAAPAAAPAQRPAGPIPSGRIAVIDVSAFAERVGEMKNAIAQLNAKFEPQTKELLALRDRMTGLENQVKQGTASAQQVAQMSDQYEQLKREFQRKNEDLTAAGRQAYDQATKPIRDKMSKALQAYAQQHGIVLVIEIGAALDKNSIFYVAPGADITDAFITEYNKTNPAK